MKLFQRRENEIDSKSITIAIMYLTKEIGILEKRLEELSGDEAFNTEYDIKCLENTIMYLEKI